MTTTATTATDNTNKVVLILPDLEGSKRSSLQLIITTPLPAGTRIITAAPVETANLSDFNAAWPALESELNKIDPTIIVTVGRRLVGFLASKLSYYASVKQLKINDLAGVPIRVPGKERLLVYPLYSCADIKKSKRAAMEHRIHARYLNELVKFF